MFENKSTNLVQELSLKKQQLDTLLEMVQMLNQKVVRESPEQLIRIFELSLRAYFGVEKVCAIFKQNQYWACPFVYGFDKTKEDIESLLTSQNIDLRTIQNFLNAEHTITLSNATEHNAAIFVSQKDIDPSLKQSNITFVKTLFNVLLSKLALKELIKQQIEQEALQRELKVAGEIQTNLLPKTLPNHKNLSITSFNQPYIQVGGDFYDVIKHKQEQYYLVIADVAGKGISAAIMMANLQASLRSLIVTHASLPSIVKNLNKLILELTNQERFLTLFIAKLDLHKKELYYINCGHPYPILKIGKKVKLLQKGTTILGSFSDIKIQVGREKLYEPCYLVLYTDGISEATNPKQEMYEIDRIVTVVQNFEPFNSPQLLKTTILSDWKNFQKDNKPNDDATLLVCYIHPQEQASFFV
ncbi:MAG: PP2C family protein-serine/threonine phosphatase [Bacteroidia bacterium]|nr:PP2C family protein-serine/threonine phosphatase [Bacteroidia bacterium]MDW8346621.1 PP2C family protein-serine/threonine phosphatase [Bacteroidia bacterium]